MSKQHRIPLVSSSLSGSVRTGAFLWGDRNRLFASVEADDEGIACPHVAIDVEQGRIIWKFPVSESGDAMAIDPQSTSCIII